MGRAMKLFLAYESSLSVIRYLRAIGDGTLEGTVLRQRTLRDALTKSAQLDTLDTTAQRILEHAGEKVHAFVPHRENVTKTSRLVTHLLSGTAPTGSFIDIGHDICVSTPAFLFMQLATKLDEIELIKIGLELCGHFSLWRLPPATEQEQRDYASEHTENRGATFKLRQATSVSKIQRYVERCEGRRGAVKARTALHWVLNESASPMESAIYLLLCLPRSKGGYGLPQPMLNPKVTVSVAGSKTDRFPDLFWRSRNIDVEYNSDEEHSDHWSRYRDARREVQLTTNQINVLPLTRIQVMDAEIFHEFADGLRKMLGRRTRPLRGDWSFRRAELRKAVLFS